MSHSRLHESESSSKLHQRIIGGKKQIVVSHNHNITGKKISADLAHLSEPESPERKHPSTGSFRFDKEIRLSNKNQFDSQLMSGQILQEADPTTDDSFPQPLSNPTQIKVTPLSRRRNEDASQKEARNSRKAKVSNTVSHQLQLPQAQMIIQIERTVDNGNQISLGAVVGGAAANRRNTNRFRSEIVSKQSRKKGNRSPMQSTQVNNSVTNYDQFKEKTTLMGNSPNPDDHQRSEQAQTRGVDGNLPVVLRIPENEYDSFLNRSSLPISGSPEIIPVSFGNTMSHMKAVTKVVDATPDLYQGSQIQQHKGKTGKLQRQYLPPKVDIGLRGRMPFDAQLRVDKVLVGETLAKKRQTLLEETTSNNKFRGKSELGFTSTLMSATTSSVAVSGPVYQRSESVQNEYGSSGGVAQPLESLMAMTNHPGTLLKNFNPKIGPKNRESEQAKKKVQNLLKKAAPMAFESSPKNNDTIRVDQQKFAVIVTSDAVDGGIQVTPIARFSNTQKLQAENCAQTLQISRIDPKLISTTKLASPRQEKQEIEIGKGMHLKSKISIVTQQNELSTLQISEHHQQEGKDISHLIDQAQQSPKSAQKQQRPQFEIQGQVVQTAAMENTKKFVKDSSEPDLSKSKNRLLLENMNTDTHRILQISTSRDGKAISSTGVITQRPSNNDITQEEFLNSQQAEESVAGQPNQATALAGKRNAGTTVESCDLYPQRSQPPEKDTKVTQKQQQLLTYKEQMLQLLGAEGTSQLITKQVESQVISSAKESSNVSNQGVVAADQTRQQQVILENKSAPPPTTKASKKMTVFIRENESYGQHQNPRHEINKNSSNVITVTDRGINNKDSPPFRRISLPAISQKAHGSPATATNLNQTSQLRNPEKLKIKQIVREVMQTQQQQMRGHSIDSSTRFGGGLGGGSRGFKSHQYQQQHSVVSNKHKTNLTNLLSLQERTAGFATSLPNSDIIVRDKSFLHRHTFKDPLLNMLSSISSTQSDKNTMFGFRKRKVSCLSPSDAVAQEVAQPRHQGIDAAVATSDYIDQNDDPSMTRTNNFKTSRAPLALKEQLIEKAQAAAASYQQRQAETKKSRVREKRCSLIIESDIAAAKGRKSSLTTTMRRQNGKESSILSYSPNRRSKNHSYYHVRHNSQIVSPTAAAGVVTCSNPDRKAGEVDDREKSKSCESSTMVVGIDSIQKWGPLSSIVQQTMLDESEKIKIRDGNNSSKLILLASSDKADLDYVQNGRLMDSEIGQRDFKKNPLVTQSSKRHVKSVIGSQKSPKAGTHTSAAASRIRIGMGNASQSNSQSRHIDNYSTSHQQIRHVSQNAVRSKSRALVNDSNKQSHLTSADNKSVVQMIELELPNLHTKEDQVSPQRVMVLSREYTSSPSVDKSKKKELLLNKDAFETVLNNVQGFTRDGKINEDSNDDLGEAVAHEVSSIASYQKPAPKYSEQGHQHHQSKQQTSSSPSVKQKESSLNQMARVEENPSPNVVDHLNDHYYQQLYHLNHSRPSNKRQSNQVLRDLRIQAELARKQVPILEENFTLVSGAVQIHNDDPLQFRKEYFSQLKQQDIEMKTHLNHLKAIQKLQIKEELKARKTMHRNCQRARTQLSTYEQKANSPRGGNSPSIKQVVAEIAETGGNRRLSEFHITAELEQTQEMPATTYRGGEKSPPHEKSQNNDDDDDEKGAALISSPAFKALDDDTALIALVPSGEHIEQKTLTKKQRSKRNVAFDQQQVTFKVPKVNKVEKQGVLKGVKDESQKSIVTSKPKLGLKASNSKNQNKIGKKESKSNLRSGKKLQSKPRFTLPLVEDFQPEQFDAIDSLAFLDGKSQVQTQTNLLERTISNHMSEVSFVQLKQQQLENPDLQQMANTFLNRNESLNGSRGFKTSLKKLSVKEGIRLSLANNEHASTQFLNATLKASGEARSNQKLDQSQLMIDFREHGTNPMSVGINTQTDDFKVNSLQQQPQSPKLKHKNDKVAKKSTAVVSYEGKHYIGDTEAGDNQVKPWSKGQNANNFIKNLVSNRSSIDDEAEDSGTMGKKDEAVGPDSFSKFNDTHSTYQQIKTARLLNPPVILTTSTKKQSPAKRQQQAQSKKQFTGATVVNLFDRLQLR